MMTEGSLFREFAVVLPEQKLRTCVHCGMCLPQCPTYRALGVETDSPRGRLYLMKALADAELKLTEGFVEHMEKCLNCRNCEAVCPSGVRFGELMELTRGIIHEQHPRSVTEKLLRNLLLEQVLPHPRRLDLAMLGAKLYQQSLQNVFHRFNAARRLPGLIQAADAMLPQMPPRFFKPPQSGIVKAVGKPKLRVGFFSGCIMRSMFADVNNAAVRVLAVNHCDVVIPGTQTCCGAVHMHNGVRRTAAALARRNIDAFKEADVDYIVVNSAGCGATLKEYTELLHGDHAYAQATQAFSNKVKDFNEFLAAIDLETRFNRMNLRVTYHDPCHLVHVQKVRAQ
ncbi:MAG: (Fe-S)-binding protein, partial [Candidatus Bathyarchaeia archaeon]